MKTVIHIAIGFVLALGLTAGSALASEQLDYNPVRFDQAQAADRPILVDIAASWCPVCKVQASVVQKVLLKPAFSHFVVFKVDFDSQKNTVRRFRADMQSTLIVYKGRKEVARVIGATDPGAIEAMLRRATD